MKGKTSKPAAGSTHLLANRAALDRVVAALSLLVRVLAILLGFACLCPVKYYPITPGFDPSWAYALNLAHTKGMIWGRDIAFPYGPWAFLSIGMNVGNNLRTALIFQTCCWLVLIPVLWFLIVKQGPSIIGVLVFIFTLGFGQSALERFGYAGLDHYLVMVVVMLLASAHLARRWEPAFIAATLIAALPLMIKFSAGILAPAAVAAFGLSNLVHDRVKATRSLALAAVLFPCAAVLLYCSHNPSFGTMAQWLRSSLELGDAYSVAKSLATDPSDLAAAGVMLGGYLLLTVMLFLFKDKSAPFAAALLVPWFFVFKHGFVRSDAHVGIFFTMGGFMLGVLCLLIGTRRAFYGAAGLLLIGAILFRPEVGRILQWRSVLPRVPSLAIRNLSNIKQRLDAQSAGALAEDRLPTELLNRIGQESVTPFPWELSYGAANPVHLAMMPMLQSYSTDSAWLDRWNARMFETQATRPEFVLFEWKSLDGRHPLLDSPATSLSLYRWYDFDGQFGEKLLLRRRDAARFTGVRPLLNVHGEISKLVNVPESQRPVTGAVSMRLTTYGRLVKLLWKVPDVMLEAFSGDGLAWAQRITPDTLSNDGPFSFVPFDPDGMRMLFEQQRSKAHVRQFRITGPGSSLYEPEFTVRFAELEGVTLPDAASPIAEFARIPTGGNINTWRIDSVNGRDAGAAQQVSFEKTPPFMWLKGWAVDPFSEDCAGAVAVEMDGKLMQAVYGIPKPIVPVLLKGQRCASGGFEWALHLPKGSHKLQLKILSTKRDVWYTSDAPLTINTGVGE